MHELIHFCIWLQNTSVGTAVRVSPWLFPTIESFHIVGIAFLVGSVARLDARLIGLSSRGSVSSVAKAAMPWAWTGFVLAVATGSLLFSSEAEGLYSNRAFRLKILMLLLLGLNSAIYEVVTRRKRLDWEAGSSTPAGAKVTGIVSFLLWIGVIVAGRWIAYA